MKTIAFVLLVSCFAYAQDPVGAWRYPLHVVVCGPSEPVLPYSVYVSENFKPIAGNEKSWQQVIEDALTKQKHADLGRFQLLISKTVFLKNIFLVTLVPFHVLVDRCEIEIVGVLNLAPAFLEPTLVINQDIWSQISPFYQGVLFYEAYALSTSLDSKSIFYKERNSMFDYRKWLSRTIHPFSTTGSYPVGDYQSRKRPQLPQFVDSFPLRAQLDVTDSRNFISLPKSSFRLMKDALPDLNITGLISEDFEIQATPVTQAQWFTIMGTNLSVNKEAKDCPEDWIQALDRTRICPNHPVENLSDLAIQEFIDRLNQKDTQYKYSLPSELQWEYAAHADDQELFWKDKPTKYLTPRKALYKTTRVMQTLPNPRGFFDFYNVPELTKDHSEWKPWSRFVFCKDQVTTDCKPLTEIKSQYGRYWIVRGNLSQERHGKYVRSLTNYNDLTMRGVPQYDDWAYMGLGRLRPAVIGFRLVRVKR